VAGHHLGHEQPFRGVPAGADYRGIFRYLRQLALGVAGGGDRAGRAFDAQETICCWLRPT